MARVEWSELSGEEAETVLATLIYSEYPTATRVRPSRGDYGVDVVVPVLDGSGRLDVYQIKKYSGRLTAGQKRDIEESFERMLIGLVERNIPVRNWHLVAPTDLTVDTQLQGWFESLPDSVIAALFAKSDKKTGAPRLTEDQKAVITAWRDAPDRLIKWEGTPFCTSLASKYGAVIDYYLHGGEERIRSTVADVQKILRGHLALAGTADVADDDGGGDTVAVMAPSDLQDHLQLVMKVLDTDPHFRYGVDLSPHRSAVADHPDLVAATQLTRADGSTLTFRIYRRFREALNEREIPIKLEFVVGEAEQEAFDAWRKYGKPMMMPVRVTAADLPGGLGALFDKLTHVMISPEGESTPVRMRIRRPDGTVGPELRFSMLATTGPDQSGLWVRGTDERDYLTFEATRDANAQIEHFGVTHTGWGGEVAADVLPSLEWLADAHAPNVIEVAAQYGPYTDFRPAGGEEVVSDVIVKFVRALATVQTRTPTPVVVPDLTTVSLVEVGEIFAAAELIDGKTVIRRWEEITFSGGAGGPVVDPSVPYRIRFLQPLTIDLDGQHLTLGTVECSDVIATFSIDGDTVRLLSHEGNNRMLVTLKPDAPMPAPGEPSMWATVLNETADSVGAGDPATTTTTPDDASVSS